MVMQDRMALGELENMTSDRIGTLDRADVEVSKPAQARRSRQPVGDA
jgi:hypothetical protein